MSPSQEHDSVAAELAAARARPDGPGAELAAARARIDGLGAELAAARARIAELSEELALASSRDPISAALLTLRVFRTQFELDLKRSRRYGRPLSIALVDVDDFRSLNLAHGYSTGDAILAGVAEAINEATRFNDLACRVDADQFAVLFPETPAADVIVAMNRLFVGLESLEVDGVPRVSASAGVAGLETPDQSAEDLLAAAAIALDQARAAGGAKVVAHSQVDDATPSPAV